MFVVVIGFPPIGVGKDAASRQWLAATNQRFSRLDGFMGRKLLKPVERGNYTAIVEFENQAGFPAVHSSRAHEEADAKVTPLFDSNPLPKFYAAIAMEDRGGRCCRGTVQCLRAVCVSTGTGFIEYGKSGTV